jgi:hypothetical protein
MFFDVFIHGSHIFFFDAKFDTIRKVLNDLRDENQIAAMNGWNFNIGRKNIACLWEHNGWIEKSNKLEISLKLTYRRITKLPMRGRTSQL